MATPLLPFADHRRLCRTVRAAVILAAVWTCVCVMSASLSLPMYTVTSSAALADADVQRLLTIQTENAVGVPSPLPASCDAQLGTLASIQALHNVTVTAMSNNTAMVEAFAVAYAAQWPTFPRAAYVSFAQTGSAPVTFFPPGATLPGGAPLPAITLPATLPGGQPFPTLPGGSTLPPIPTLPGGTLPGGSTLPGEFTLPGGTLPGGSTLPGELTLPGGTLPGGSTLPGQLTLPGGTLPGGSTLPGELTLPGGTLPGGTLPGGATLPGELTLPGGTLPGGSTLPGELTLPGGTLPPLPLERDFGAQQSNAATTIADPVWAARFGLLRHLMVWSNWRTTYGNTCIVGVSMPSSCPATSLLQPPSSCTEFSSCGRSFCSCIGQGGATAVDPLVCMRSTTATCATISACTQTLLECTTSLAEVSMTNSSSLCNMWGLSLHTSILSAASSTYAGSAFQQACSGYVCGLRNASNALNLCDFGGVNSSQLCSANASGLFSPAPLSTSRAYGASAAAAVVAFSVLTMVLL